ncbi:MAG: glycosyltransferase family 4 protein [Candidatus Krumholzibacteria bacterium]|nr:glycosyltransferase family 4 protein [Candidatus Krumholzibacteria bacterium]
MTAILPGVLFVHRNSHPRHFGGIERKIISIIEALNGRHLARCHLLTNHQESPLSHRAASAGASLHVTSMDGFGGLARTILAANRLVARERIDLLQSHMFWASIVAGTVRRRCAHLRHVFRIHTHIEGSAISHAKRSLYHLADRLNSPGVDHYCVLSTALHREITDVSRIPAAKVSVLMNGIPSPGRPHLIQNDESPLPPRIVVLGDLQTRKRQDLVIQAMAVLRGRGLSVTCRFIGLERGGYGDELRRLGLRLGVSELLEFVGFQDPVAPWLDGYEVMLLASDFEGIPTCMVEAMGLGMVAVSTSVGGTADLIEDGRNGYLVPPGDPAILADRLELIFHSPSSRLAALREAGHETFLSRCSLDAMIAGLLRIYVQLGLRFPTANEDLP